MACLTGPSGRTCTGTTVVTDVMRMNLVQLSGNVTGPSPFSPVAGPSSEVIWLILGVVIGGLAGGISLYLAQRCYGRYKRPVLRIDREGSPVPRIIHLKSGKTGAPPRIDLDRVPYVVNRIRVRNTGRTAAENCKAILTYPGFEEKVCWQIPKERYVMTINSRDHEYVDLCAVSQIDPQSLIEQSSQTIPVNITIRILDENDVPNRIAPTENGWECVIKENRVLDFGELLGVVRITAKNAEPVEAEVRLRERPDANQRFVEFR